MNDNHVIDSWIAELGLSGRKVRRTQGSGLGQAGPALEVARPGREASHVAPVRASYARRPRYQVISSPC